MGYKIGTDKQQLTLLPVCLDDYVPENHICRVIIAFIERLDMVRLGYKYAECKNVGSRPFDPRMMLGLYIYGYLHRIRSSRRLEAETRRNVEVMWMMAGLIPDDKTICNFRKDNAKALRSTFREFSRMCHELGLYGGETIAVDGTKFRADNSRKNNHNKTTVERELSRIDKNISEYLAGLEESDSSECDDLTPSTEQIEAALKKLKARKEKFEKLQKRIEIEGEVSTIDPESRLMKQGGDARRLDVCYNVQTAVDAKHHLIVDFKVIDRSDDHGNLTSMLKKSKKVMGCESLIVLADKGYYDGMDIAECEENGGRCLVAVPKPGGDPKEKGFTKKDFIYDKERNGYLCPCKNWLDFVRIQNHSDGKEYFLYYNYSACMECRHKSKCTKAKYRKIYRTFYQDTLDIVGERTRNNKELFKKRQEIVEHPFGTIKAIWGYKQFLCRGKLKVNAEVSLAYLAYNTRRVFNIFKENKENLIAAMRA